MAKPYVLIVAGHRSYGDRGNPVERELTDDLAIAYLAAFRAAGYPADWFQQIDGDSDPTMTEGGLDGIALGVGRVLRDRPEELSLMLDLHFDGADAPIEVILAHNVGLTTAYPQGRDRADIIENNPLDLALGRRIAVKLGMATGLPLYRATSAMPGIMPETQTGVGGDGFRLAMMAATCPYRMKAARFVLEHGGTNAAAANPGAFAAKCAAATVAAVTEVLAERATTPLPIPVPPPEPTPVPEPVPVPPDLPGDALLAWLFGVVGEVKYDPTGPVSTLWRELGNDIGVYPRLVGVRQEGDTRYYQFANGEVIVTRPGVAAAWWSTLIGEIA